MNAFANGVGDVKRRFDEAGLLLVPMLPGDVLDAGHPARHDASRALARFAELDLESGALPLDRPAAVPLEQIEGAFAKLCRHLHERYPSALLRLLLEPVVVAVPDLGAALRLDFAHGRCERLAPGAPPDLSVLSQPLHFALSTPFGVQTLGVSARVVVHRGAANWLRHRILFSMNNAEVYLRPRYLFTRSNLRFARERWWTLLGQIGYKLRRHRVES
jgi:hypothetical protein